MQSSENDLEHDLADMGDETDCHYYSSNGHEDCFSLEGGLLEI